MRRDLISNPGFTLIEVMIALVIFGMGIVSVMQLFGDGLRMSYLSKSYSKALFHARNIMDANSSSSGYGVLENEYRWEKILSTYPEGEGIDKIVVKVSWKEGSIVKQVLLSTLKAKEKNK